MPQTCSGAAVPGCLIRPGRWRVALLVGLALSLGLAHGVPAATTWTVCANGCDYSSIKAAIAAPTTVDGDTLAIAAGTYTEPGIVLDKSLTLQGEDAATTIVQAAETRGTAPDGVFTIPKGVSVTLQNLTIRYGHTNDVFHHGGGLYNAGTLTLTASTVHGNDTLFGGGGLANFGMLTVTHSTVTGNSADFGGGLYNNSNSMLTLTASTVQSNKAIAGGGGLSNDGTMTLTTTTVHDNDAVFSGGGLYNYGRLTLTTTTVRDNAAAFGGGLYSYSGGPVTIIASTISHNAAGLGGGLYSAFSTLLLTNTTLSGNTATGAGGGLYQTSGKLTLTHSTLSGNATDAFGGGLYVDYGALTLTHSIVAKNPDGGDCRDLYGAISSQGYNLDSDGSCQLTASTDQPSTDPLLGPLQDNGGPTLTHALLPGSPAIDAIPWGTNGCGTTVVSDQRWQARPQPLGGACDIGAYEVVVAGQALGGWVSGFTPHSVTCKNATTGQVVTLSEPTPPWDCEAAGLAG
jgi:hypothetical protein